MLSWVIAAVGALLAVSLILDGLRRRRHGDEVSWWEFYSPLAGILWGVSLLAFIVGWLATEGEWDMVAVVLFVAAAVALVAGAIVEWRSRHDLVR